LIDIQISNLDENNLLNIEKVEKLEKFSQKICKELEIKDKIISIVIADSKIVTKLNKDFRGIDATTDVLSFPLNKLDSEDNVLGEIIIDLERASTQATEYGNSLIRELSFLILHGILHLIGYNDDKKHNGEMREVEKSLSSYLLK